MRLDLRAVAVAITLFVLELYYGMGYLAGPQQVMSSGTFTYARAVLPQQVWGAAIVGAAALTALAPRLPALGSVACHSLAAVPLTLFAVLLGAAELRTIGFEFGVFASPGPAQGWGGAATFFLPVLAHLVLGRERFRKRHAEVRLRRWRATRPA